MLIVVFLFKPLPKSSLWNYDVINANVAEGLTHRIAKG